AAAAAILNPMAPEQAGMAATRIDDTRRLTSVYLQLEGRASLILRTFTSADAIGHANPWPYYEPSGTVQQIAGKWRVHFLEGGPALPWDCDTFELVSWTGVAKEAESFAGTARYSIEFTHESNDADDWLLD